MYFTILKSGDKKVLMTEINLLGVGEKNRKKRKMKHSKHDSHSQKYFLFLKSCIIFGLLFQYIMKIFDGD